MPKRKRTPVETREKLERLLNNKNMTLSDSPEKAINQLVEAIKGLQDGSAWIGVQSRGTLPYNQRNALTDIGKVLNALRSEVDNRKALRQKQLNFANRTVVPNETGDSDFRLSALASNVTGYWDEDNDFVGDDSDLKRAGEMKLDGKKPTSDAWSSWCAVSDRISWSAATRRW